MSGFAASNQQVPATLRLVLSFYSLFLMEFGCSRRTKFFPIEAFWFLGPRSCQERAYEPGACENFFFLRPPPIIIPPPRLFFLLPSLSLDLSPSSSPNFFQFLAYSSSEVLQLLDRLLLRPLLEHLEDNFDTFCCGSNMGSETDASPAEASDSGGRTSPVKKNPCKIPKRIHKAEREKQKREHLNELFQDLANALELTQPNNGKASILCEATRLLKEIFGQIESLKKENVTLLSESRYVTIEKNELREENSALEAQIEKLQGELGARVFQSKPDLNITPPPEYDQQTEYPGMEPQMQQPPAVLIVPIQPDLPSSYHMQAPQVSKPHARYPTPADSWPSQLLGEQTNDRIELQLNGSNHSFSNREKGSD